MEVQYTAKMIKQHEYIQVYIYLYIRAALTNITPETITVQCTPINDNKLVSRECCCVTADYAGAKW